MSIDRPEILNHLIRVFGYKSYLEIGVAGGWTFKRIAIRDKTGVDPGWRWWYLFDPNVQRLTSDHFFARNRRTFDLIFVDGLHIAEQAHRDIENALACLSSNGSILVHDCLPTSREQQEVPRIQISWTGDAWRAFLKASQSSTLDTLVFDTDHGCGLIRKCHSSKGAPKPPSEIDPLSPSLTWKEFDNKKELWLRLISREQVFETIDLLAAQSRNNRPSSILTEQDHE